jgi:two-component system sensor histidine kinase YesM
LAWLKRIAVLLSFRRSIQGRIFAAFSLVILAALALVGLVVYYHMTNTIQRNATDYVADSFRRADENTGIVIQDASRLMALVVTNQEIVIPVLLSGNSEVSLEGFLDQKRMDSFLSYLIAYKSNIKRITVASAIDGRVFYEGHPYQDRLSLDWGLMEEIWLAPAEKIFIKHTRIGREDAVTLGRKIVHNRQTIGVVMIDLNYDLLRNNYNIRPSEDSSIYVLDENGEVVFRQSADDNEAEMNGKLLREAMAVDGVREMGHGGSRQLVVSLKAESTGWTTVGIIPQRALMKDSFTLGQRIVQAVVLVYLAVLLVSIAVASHITRNLRQLYNAMKRVQEGNFFVTANITAQDEVGQFYRMFQSMLGRIRELMDGLKQREALKREAELAALQAQIRPHFLYNSLNTIKYLAALNGARNIEEVSSSLIEMLRGVLGHTNEFIPLREELSYVRSYLTIQRYKYADRFQVVYEIDDQLLDAPVLKLILQPLVENALTHGIGSLPDHGSIWVKAFRDGTELVLEVGDNGVGMTAAQMEAALRTDTLRDGFREGGMGIRNVNERIRMVYGPAYGVRLYSRPHIFTKAEIRIPIAKGENGIAERFVGGRRAAGLDAFEAVD